MNRILMILVSLFVLGGCASNRAHRVEQQLQRFEAAAGLPVQSFRYFGFNSWTSLGSEHLAVWTRPSEAWLIEVYGFCPDLDFAQRIGVTSSLNRVYARFDTVITEQGRCRIKSIRPVDVKALRELQREARRQEIEMRDSGTPHREDGAEAD